MTASYSASLLVARNLRVSDYSMMDPSGVVWTTPTLVPLPFDTLFMFKIHPFKKLSCDGGLGVNSTMESTNICPLIVVLGSKIILSGQISITHLVILPLASGFSTMVLSGYSIGTTTRKD